MEKTFTVSFLGKDERGDIIKGIEIISDSVDGARDIIKQLKESREIYGIIEQQPLPTQTFGK